MTGPIARRWIRRDTDEAAALGLARAAGISARLARLLLRRGVTDTSSAERYLRPKLTDLHDPATMKGVERAAARLADAVERRESITLYGDYDVDGVTSASLLASFLRHHGLEPRVYIPKRLVEGYGLNQAAVEQIAADGAQILVTLDCGITAADEVARANALGLAVIVVDHHKCPPELPPAYATLNPQQSDCGYPEPVLAAVGVCFNLIIQLRKVLRERGHYAGREEPNLRRYMDLVALGTICDMVPLTGVNRVLSWFGMESLRRTERPGLLALMEVSKVRPPRASSGDVGFKLGPRINAAGRLHDASIGVRLLLTEDMAEARRLAAALDDANLDRRRIEAEVFEDAAAAVAALPRLPSILVLANPEWHPGVVGIVASKLVERYDRAAVVIGEGGRGSARTARGLHLYDALSAVSSHLIKFGGHRAAAGLRIASRDIDAFRSDLVARVEADGAFADDAEPILMFDDDLAAGDIDEGCLAEVQQMEPFGSGNPEPLFRVPSVRVTHARVVGKDHLKLRLAAANGGLGAIAFKMAELEPSLFPGCEVQLACHVEENEFNGNRSLELRVRELNLA